MDLPTIQKLNFKEFSDMNKSISKYGKTCEMIGRFQGVFGLKKFLSADLYKQVLDSIKQNIATV